MMTINRYQIVLVAVAFIAITTLYNCFGVLESVLWNTLIKTSREGLLIYFLFRSLPTIKNPLEGYFLFGLIAISASYTVFRFGCAIAASDWNEYMSFMAETQWRLLMSMVIFIILVVIKLLNRKRTRR